MRCRNDRYVFQFIWSGTSEVISRVTPRKTSHREVHRCRPSPQRLGRTVDAPTVYDRLSTLGSVELSSRKEVTVTFLIGKVDHFLRARSTREYRTVSGALQRVVTRSRISQIGNVPL